MGIWRYLFRYISLESLHSATSWQLFGRFLSDSQTALANNNDIISAPCHLYRSVQLNGIYVSNEIAALDESWVEKVNM